MKQLFTFKRKPKPDVMGFICCETTLNRASFLIESFQQDDLLLPVYLYSTAMMMRNLKKKYSDGIVSECEQHCDRFFLKKYQQFHNINLKERRKEIIGLLENDTYIQDFIEENHLSDEKQILENNFRQWKDVPLLLDDHIKSM